MSTFNNALDEIDYYRKSFVGIESIIFQNNSGGSNENCKKIPNYLSAPVTEEKRGSSFSRRTFQSIRSIPVYNELPSDVPVPNSVARNSSFCSITKDSSIIDQQEDKRLSKDEIKALINGAVLKQMKNENETSKQTENAKRPKRMDPRRTSRSINMERRLSKRQSNEIDRRKSMLRSVRRTCEEQASEIRPSLLEEIRKAIQLETSRETGTELIIADKHLEKYDEESTISKDRIQSDTIASSNAWLESVTERLSVSSRRVSELSKKIAATRKSSKLSVDSDDSVTWSQRMNDMDAPSKSKQSMSERLRNLDSRSSKQGRDRLFGTSVAPKTSSRSNNVSRDSKSRMKRAGSPSVLSDRSSFTYRSDDYSSYSRSRKTRSADKERRNSFSNIKVGPAMTRQLELERMQSSSNMKIKASRSNISSYNRSNSYDKMKESVSRSSGAKLTRRSKTALENSSNERLARKGTRSRSNCSVGEAGLNERRSLTTKRTSLTELIDLYYANHDRRSTIESLKNYRESVIRNENNDSNSKMKEKENSVISINKSVKTPQSSNSESFEKNNYEDSLPAPYTPKDASRSSISFLVGLGDEDNNEKQENHNNSFDDGFEKSVEGDDGVDNNINNKISEVEEEKKKKKNSEKGNRRLSLVGAETLVVPTDFEDTPKQTEMKISQRKSSLKKSSISKQLRRKSKSIDLINSNKKIPKVEDASRLMKAKKPVLEERLIVPEEINSLPAEVYSEANQTDVKRVENDTTRRKSSLQRKSLVSQKRGSQLKKKSVDQTSTLKNSSGKMINPNNGPKTDFKGGKQNKYDGEMVPIERISLFRNINEDKKSNRVSKRRPSIKDKSLNGNIIDKSFERKMLMSNVET